MRIWLVLFCLCALGAKSDEEEYSRLQCKDIGYYIAVTDADDYRRWQCDDQHLTPADMLRCEGMMKLSVQLSKELFWRLDHPDDERICNDEL